MIGRVEQQSMRGKQQSALAVAVAVEQPLTTQLVIAMSAHDLDAAVCCVG